MGTFFGRDANLNLTPEQMSLFGLPGIGGKKTTTAEGTNSEDTDKQDCYDACQAAYDAFILTHPGVVGRNAAEIQKKLCLEVCNKRTVADRDTPPKGSPLCKKECDTVFQRAMQRGLNLRQATKDRDNCYSICDGGTGTTCPEGKIWDDIQKKCVVQSPNCPPGQLWDEAQKKCVVSSSRCTPPLVWDDVQKKCVKPTGQCTPPLIWDETLKKCVSPNSAECGTGAGAEWTGCAPCGKKYMLTTGSCLAGYVPVPKPEGTQCECVKWCKDIGYGEDCQSGKGGTTPGTLGEFKMPPEMMEFYNMLMGRGKEYLERRPGYSDPTMALLQGAGTDRLRAGDNARRQAMTSQLGSQGLLGTGAGSALLSSGARDTEAGISNLIRDLTISNEDKKTSDRESFTGIANQLFGTGTEFNKTIEMMNSNRRMEGQSSLALYLQYLKMLMDSWAQ